MELAGASFHDFLSDDTADRGVHGVQIAGRYLGERAQQLTIDLGIETVFILNFFSDGDKLVGICLIP